MLRQILFSILLVYILSVLGAKETEFYWTELTVVNTVNSQDITEVPAQLAISDKNGKRLTYFWEINLLTTRLNQVSCGKLIKTDPQKKTGTKKKTSTKKKTGTKKEIDPRDCCRIEVSCLGLNHKVQCRFKIIYPAITHCSYRGQ